MAAPASPKPEMDVVVDRRCRFCGAPLSRSFADLGATPPANRFLDPALLSEAEPFFSLHAYVCGDCFLVQLEAFQSPDDIFGDYAYFSSYSEDWLAHAKAYATRMIAERDLGADSLVVEVASNDGYLLGNFVDAGVPVLGIEPAANVAAVARERGVNTRAQFFGVETAREMVARGERADLLVGNNVLAHVPDLNDFVAGLALVLKPEGLLTMEFPHLLNLMRHNQFDTIYHEHFSYFSALTAQRVFAAHGLALFDVERLPTHGGSLRVHVAHQGHHETGPGLETVLQEERAAGLDRLEAYDAFAEQVRETKRKLLSFLIEAKRAGKSIVGYGAAAKGNTLLNYCGIGTDFLDFVVDSSPSKQGRLLPGTRIPIRPPSALDAARPDYVLILPWNWTDEIVRKAAHIRDWGGRFVVPIPEPMVID